ncbi:unnamed protein product, partial [Polarella glacialis]
MDDVQNGFGAESGADAASVVSLVHACAKRTPGAPALRWLGEPLGKGEEVWSYRAMWGASCAAASKLRALVGPRLSKTVEVCVGDMPLKVGLMVTEGTALPLLELAILLNSWAIVPLDPEEPAARLRLVLEDAGPLAAILVDDAHKSAATELLAGLTTGVSAGFSDSRASGYAANDGLSTSCHRGNCAVQKQVASQLPLLVQPYELLPTEPGHAQEMDFEEPELRPSGASVSHVFYTSGSTGRPKGCVCTHANLAAYCLAKNAAHQVGLDSVVFVASAHTFDPSLGDFMATWASGGCVAMAPRRILGAALGACLRQLQATHLLTTPAHFATIEASSSSVTGPADLPQLQVVALGGELMSQQIVDTWASSHVRLLNTYGVTECTVYQ